MRKFRVLKPVSINKGMLPVDRELLPGDFGLPESHLDEMVSKGQVEEIKQQPRRSKPKDEGETE